MPRSVDSSRKAFVTGGGGYVGSTLCRQLVERGYSVVAFDLHYPEEKDQTDERIQKVKVSLTSLIPNCVLFMG